MLEKIKMINFESHVDTEIDFTNGITILTGNSGQGKSGIFRALRFVLLNLSEGEDSINYDADECSVEIIYNGHSIKRVRSRKGKNEYWLDGTLYKAFGQSVPIDIAKVLNLNPINFEWQFDKRPFLLSETGGYIASKLNEIVDLKLIDSSLKNIESDRRASNKEKEKLTKEAKELEEKIAQFDWVELAEKKLKMLENLQEYLEVLQDDISMEHSLLSDLNTIQSELESIKLIDDDIIDETVRLLESFEENKKSLDSLITLRDSYLQSFERYQEIELIEDSEIEDLFLEQESCEELETLIHSLRATKLSYNDVVDRLNSLQNVINERRIARVERSLQDYEELKQSLLNARTLHEAITKNIFNISNIDIELDKLKKEYREIAPDVCPICGNEMSRELE